MSKKNRRRNIPMGPGRPNKSILGKDPQFSQILIETAKFIIVILDPKGQILYFNPYLEEVSGWKLEEMEGKDWFTSFLPECDYDKIREVFRNAVHDIDTAGTINPILTRDGQKRLIEWANKTLRDPEGNLIGVLASGVDITDQAKAFDDLRKSEIKFRDFIESATEGFTFYDSDLNLIGFNKASLAGTGWKREKAEEMLGKNIVEISPEVETSGRLDEYRRVLETGDPFTVEEVIAPPHLLGENRYLSVRAFRVGDGLGIITTDITKKKLAEVQLRIQSLVIDQSANSIAIIDPGGVVEYANLKFLQAYHMKPDEVIGANWRSFLSNSAALREKYQEIRDTVLNKGLSWKGEVNDIGADGGEIWREATFFPVKNEKGEVFRTVYISQDITERKNAEFLLAEQHNLVTLLSASSSLDYALRLCVQAAMKVSGMDCGGIYLIGRDVRDMELKYQEGLSEEFIRSASYYHFESASTKLILQGRPIYSQHLHLGIPLADPRVREGLKAIAIIPIVHEGKVIACMNIASHQQEEVPERARHSLETIAAHIGSIIARLQMEEELRNNEEKLRIMFDSVGEGITVTDLEGNIQQTNTATVLIHGAKNRADFVGKNSFELISENDREKAAENMRVTLETGRSGVLEYRMKRIDGNEFEAELNASLLKDKEGNPAGFIAITRDISERKRSENALKKSEEQSRLLLESITDGVYAFNQDWEYIMINDPGANLVNIPKEELIGKKLFDLFPGIEDTEFFKIYRKTMVDREPSTIINEFIHPDGRKGWYEVHTYPYEEGILCVATDVTERKRMEENLRHSEKMATLGEISGTIAHEIKNPLFAISSGLQVLDAKLKLKAKEKETLNIIFTETMRIDRLIKQLTSFAHYQVQQQMSLSIVRLDRLVNETIAFNQGLAESQGIKVRKIVAKTVPPLNADRDRLEQVLINLLQNAVSFSKKDDTITIEVKEDRRRNSVLIEVSDRGPGVPEEFREKIFDPLYSTKKGSTGMGLAISKGIVTDHGGEIRCEPRKGGGSRFVVRLPTAGNK